VKEAVPEEEKGPLKRIRFKRREEEGRIPREGLEWVKG